MFKSARTTYLRVNRSPAGLVLLVFAAVLPTALYWFLGYGGDDAEFHITSLLELLRAFHAHTWRLGWASGASYGFGSPRFCFYPPFDSLLSTGLSFLFPLRWVPGLQVWLLLTVAGCSMYITHGRLVSREHRIAAALFYMFSGYLLLATLEHYDIAEAWVDAVLPLNFLCFVRIVCREERRVIVPAALLFGFAWLTNVPAAIVLFYTFGVTTFVIAMLRKRVMPLLLYGSVIGISLALAAFRLAPVFVEKKWIHPEALLLFDIHANMIFTRLPSHPAALLFINACAVFPTLPLVFVANQTLRRGRPGPFYLVPLITIAGICLIPQLAFSMPLWRHLPELAFVSFPFRFQIFLALAVPLAVFAPGVGWRLRAAACLMWVLLAAYPLMSYSRLLPEHRIVSMANAAQQWKNGYPEVPEYLPATVPIGLENALAADPVQRAMAHRASGCDAMPVFQSPNRNVWSVASSAGCGLTLGTFCYPFWRAQLENGIVLSLRCNTRSLIQAEIPAGEHRLTIEFDPQTPLRTLTAWISALVLLALIGAEVYFLKFRPPWTAFTSRAE